MSKPTGKNSFGQQQPAGSPLRSACAIPFMMKSCILRPGSLAVLILLCCLGYFLLIACAPALLVGSVAGWPRSILLALLLFALFLAITVWQVGVSERKQSE